MFTEPMREVAYRVVNSFCCILRDLSACGAMEQALPNHFLNRLTYCKTFVLLPDSESKMCFFKTLGRGQYVQTQVRLG